MHSRIAEEADVEAIAQTVALAFADDPSWGPQLEAADGSDDHLIDFWRPFVAGAVPHGETTVVDGTDAGGRPVIASVAIWLPPGVPELDEAGEAAVFAAVGRALAPERLEAFAELWARFEAAHPREVPHAYLTILATHPQHRGHGYAQQMVACALARYDEAGLPAYLESSNDGNDRRYERLGFRTIGQVVPPLEPDRRIATMWHEAG